MLCKPDEAHGATALGLPVERVMSRPFEPSRTWFGRFRTDSGRIDLKRAGLFGIVSCARALAICHGVPARSTAARLHAVKALHMGLDSDLDFLIEAHGLLLDLILRQQIVDIANGRSATNTVVVNSLPRLERERLRTALRAVESLNEITRNLLFKS